MAQIPVFFISDLHLDHGNIIRYCNRPFRTVREMNSFIIDTWNKTVRKNDIVYFLGDLAFGRRGSQYWLDKLNGEIHLVRGHHDRYRGYTKLLLNVKGRKFLLVHNPHHVHYSWTGWVIHGHVHNNNLRDYPLINYQNKTINVSADILDYKPISFKKILRLVERYE